MVQGFIEHMESQYSKDDLRFEIPGQLSNIDFVIPGSEIIKSNTMMPLRLLYSHNIVQQSIAYIFVNTECNGLPYEQAREKGLQASKAFSEVLQFQEVTVFTDQSYKKIEDLLVGLRDRSQKFAEETQKEKKNVEDLQKGSKEEQDEVVEEFFKAGIER